MQPSYLFYDIETTGLSKAFDQVLRFAAVRTDEHLEALERFAVDIRLRPDVIPSPAAVLTNRIPRAEWQAGASEFEAIGRIHRWLNTPDTVSVGYNSLGFDDAFLRFAFYRNLLPPYTHQYRNGCRRMDILPMTILFWLYKPEVMQWPSIEGAASLKLEHLAAANSLLTGPAHDAAADVEATLALARRLHAHKQMWHYAAGCFRKEVDSRRAEELPIRLEGAAGRHRLGLMIAGEFGTGRNFQAPVLSLGDSIPYPNQSLWLRLDLEDLQATLPEAPAETTWVIRKRFGEPGILLPPHQRYWRRMGPERDRLVTENIRWLEAHGEVLLAIVEHYRHFRYPFVPDLDVDAALYQVGFFPRQDEALARKFRQTDPAEWPLLVDQFSNPAARALAVRIIGRNCPEHLAPPWDGEFRAYLGRVNPATGADAIRDYSNNARTTPRSALTDLRRLRAEMELDVRQQRLLDDLEAHIVETFGKPGGG